MAVIAATSELVAISWLTTLPGITSGMVASTLPVLPTDPVALAASWASTGFLTVAIAGGTPDLDLPIRRPLVQVDAWWVAPNSQRPPWAKCDQLMAKVMAGCHGTISGTREVNCQAGTSTVPARVYSAWAAMEPMRLYSDDASYAHLRCDLRLDWSKA